MRDDIEVMIMYYNEGFGEFSDFTKFTGTQEDIDRYIEYLEASHDYEIPFTWRSLY